MRPVNLPDGFDLLDLHVAHPDRYPFLLETVSGGSVDHRAADSTGDTWDLLFAFPGPTLQLDGSFRLAGPGSEGQADFLGALDSWWRDTDPAHPPAGHLPFSGGWFLFLGYDLARQIEPLDPDTRTPNSGPIAFATRIPVAIVRNRRNQQAWIIAEDSHLDHISVVLDDLQKLSDKNGLLAKSSHLPRSVSLVSELREPDSAIFLKAVAEVRRLIANGDVYQVNLSHRWQATVRKEVSHAGIYHRLRQTNPAPFAGLATRGDWSVISSSPERLVRCRAGRVETRPIAGTYPRAENSAEEDVLRRDLLANPKERAEHIMLIDLERNDLGRVCQPGTVTVDEFMVVESYAHVHHIVSNVCGQLRPGTTPGAVIRAVFPGGTITGCPKVRCMEVIAALEPASRGPYTGSMGYLNLDGSMDLNILIRSFVLEGRKLAFSAGGGIVADSDPARELVETHAKAKGLLMALGGKT
ncbi:MAG: aminodeoxychorismate synthase component I [Gammaproteobacteria bacterium]